MTDRSPRHELSRGRFRRHLLAGGLLGLCVGASWELMAWLWTPGQFAPLQLSIWGMLLGLCGGCATFCALANRNKSTASQHSISQIRAGFTWPSFAEHVAWGILVGVAGAPFGLTSHWTGTAGQAIFAVVGWLTCAIAENVVPRSIPTAPVFMRVCLPPAGASISNCDASTRPGLDERFAALTDACNACHEAEKVPFFEVRPPETRISPIRREGAASGEE